LRGGRRILKHKSKTVVLAKKGGLNQAGMIGNLDRLSVADTTIANPTPAKCFLGVAIPNQNLNPILYHGLRHRSRKMHRLRNLR
jgi:hypothetical protein